MKIYQKLSGILLRYLRGNAFELTAASYISAVIGFITSIAATRLSSPSEYGAAALIMSFPSLIWSFASFKPSSIVTRYIIRYRSENRHEEVLSVCKLGYILDIATSLFVLIIILFASQLIAKDVYAMPDTAWLIVIYSLSMPVFSLIGTSQAIFSSWQSFRLMSIYMLFERVITLILTVVLLLEGFGVTGLVIAVAIAQSITGISSAIAATRILARDGSYAWWSARLQLVYSLRAELAAMFSWNYLLTTLSGITAQLPLIILGRLLGTKEAGYYRLGLTIATIAGYIEQSLAKVAYPKLSTWFANIRSEHYGLQLRRWTIRGGIPAAAMIVLGTIITPFAIPMIFGDAYTPMIFGTQCLLILGCFRTIFFWLTPHYFASGELKTYTFWYMFYTIVVVVLCWIVAPWWGFTGVAIVCSLSYALMMVALLLFDRHQFFQNSFSEGVVL